MLRILPYGPKAFLVEVESDAEVLSLLAEVTIRCNVGWLKDVVNIVPGERTVLFDGVGNLDTAKSDLMTWKLRAGRLSQEVTVELECRYDGPDIGRVAELWNMTEQEVINYHSSLSHQVIFCGFSPGFAYIRGLDEDHLVPRRASPRPSVDAGSVGLARLYTGVYPHPSPGGWQLIGRCETRIWDETQTPPALLTPGTKVKFVPI